MTVSLDEAASEDASATTELASWRARVGAFALDLLLVVAVGTVLLLTVAQYDGPWWGYASVVAAVVVVVGVNRWWLAAQTGWTLGRAVFAIRVERADDGADTGLGRLVLRDLAHLLDTLGLFVGWLWPLWDRRRRTFADILCGTEVRAVGVPPRNAAKHASIALLAAAVLCLAGSGAGLARFLHNRAVDQARQQVSEQGPRIVEQVLSYHSDTYKDDFNKAQSLVTDSYRGQLVKEQQRQVAKGAPATNEYWAVSSAVLEPVIDPDRVWMLVALQGQRGADAKGLKLITATLRVEFVRSGDGKWQLSSLQVLQRPLEGPVAQAIPQPSPAQSKNQAPAPSNPGVPPQQPAAPSHGGTR
ncbi:Mce-associated membrane protein [Mycobacterium sp. MAA66]|uniref:RDD family protein n=1 Tax=Mycobacterium sp. MAA66 TaxID=3156297 RepID=UPI0035122491